MNNTADAARLLPFEMANENGITIAPGSTGPRDAGQILETPRRTNREAPSAIPSLSVHILRYLRTEFSLTERLETGLYLIFFLCFLCLAGNCLAMLFEWG